MYIFVVAVCILETLGLPVSGFMPLDGKKKKDTLTALLCESEASASVGRVTHCFSVRHFICMIVFVAALWCLFIPRPPLLLRFPCRFLYLFLLSPSHVIGFRQRILQQPWPWQSCFIMSVWKQVKIWVCVHSLKTGDASYVIAKLIN